MTLKLPVDLVLSTEATKFYRLTKQYTRKAFITTDRPEDQRTLDDVDYNRQYLTCLDRAMLQLQAL